MPVYKCNNGKWRIGKDGECRFSSKQKAENAFDHWVETKESIKEDEEKDEEFVYLSYDLFNKLIETIYNKVDEIDEKKIDNLMEKIYKESQEQVLDSSNYKDIVSVLEDDSSEEEQTDEDMLLDPSEVVDGNSVEDSNYDDRDDDKKELEELLRLSGKKK